MKTVYIPRGETVSYDNLATECLVVEGGLKVTYDLKAKKIIGSGSVTASSISADDIRADELSSVRVSCRRLIAKRVETSELFASESAAVSCLLSADYVQASQLSVVLSYVHDVDAVEIINLKQKKRGLFRFLLASSLRSWWTRLTAPADDDALTQIGAQRSGFDLERRHSEMSELSALAGSEGYGACADDAEYEVKNPTPVVHLETEKENKPAA